MQHAEMLREVNIFQDQLMNVASVLIFRSRRQVLEIKSASKDFIPIIIN